MRIAEFVDMIIMDTMDGIIGDVVEEWSRPGLGMAITATRQCGSGCRATCARSVA